MFEIQKFSQGESISNPQIAIAAALKLSSEVATVWASGDVQYKERLQKLVFPQGIIYDRKNRAFRTPKVNSVFSLIASLSSVSGGSKNRQTADDGGLSNSVIPLVQNSNHFIEDLKKLADLSNDKLLKSQAEVNNQGVSPNTKYSTAQVIEQHHKTIKKRTGFRM